MDFNSNGGVLPQNRKITRYIHKKRYVSPIAVLDEFMPHKCALC